MKKLCSVVALSLLSCLALSACESAPADPGCGGDGGSPSVPEETICSHVPCREDIPEGSCPANWNAYTVNSCSSDEPARGCVLAAVQDWACTYGDAEGMVMVHVQCCCEIGDCELPA